VTRTTPVTVALGAGLALRSTAGGTRRHPTPNRSIAIPRESHNPVTHFGQ